MKKVIGAVIALLLCLLPACAAGKGVYISGTVVNTDPIQINSAFGGRVESVSAFTGDYVNEGDELVSLAGTKVYALQDGTVHLFAGAGDSADAACETFGAVAYIEAASPISISASTQYAYESEENKIIHPGESVYVRAINNIKHVGVGYVTGVSGTNYTVQLTEGSFTAKEAVFIYRDAGYTYMLGRFGVEGVNWIKTEDYLAKHPTAEISTSLEGYEPTYVSEDSHMGEIVNVFLTAQNVNWFDQMPTFSGVSDYHGGFISKYEDGYEINAENSGGVRQNSITGVYQQFVPGLGLYCPNLNFTNEELEEISKIRADIKSFVNEQRTNYILGRESYLSDKDAFLAELEKIGLSKLLEVADAAYQRGEVHFVLSEHRLGEEIVRAGFGPGGGEAYAYLPAAVTYVGAQACHAHGRASDHPLELPGGEGKVSGEYQYYAAPVGFRQPGRQSRQTEVLRRLLGGGYGEQRRQAGETAPPES